MTDLRTILVGSAIVVAMVFVVLVVVTLLASVRAWQLDHRRIAARERVRTALFERRLADDPDWVAWVDTLSRRERAQLSALVEQYLRTVGGNEREVYLTVARALDMGEKADAALDSPGELPRLRALARLTLLDYPVTSERLLEMCLDERRTRSAAARLLYERRDEFDRPETLGTSILIWDGSRPMTARGMATLYDLNQTDPGPLLSQGDRSSHLWEIPLLVQVCTVLGSCQTAVSQERFEWVFRLFDHSNPTVRAAAIELFGGIGWRDDLRASIPFRHLMTDDNVRVRRATYRTLSEWGDREAHHLLEWAVVDEENSRAQLDAVRALASLEGDPARHQPGWPDDAWEWVRAERAVVDLSTHRTRGGLA